MDVLKFKNFKSFENIRHGISVIKHGSMKNIDGNINRKNLKHFLQDVNVKEEAVCMEQVHGKNIAVVQNIEDLKIKNVDGLVTNKPNIPLVIMTADCLPIIFAELNKKVIGVAHAGRRGLDHGIIKNILRTFKEKFNVNPEDLFVGIGPGIEKKCYEVDGNLMNIRKNAVNSLLEEGVNKDNIESIENCTKCDSDFYSYRGGDRYKRFATVIEII